MNKQFMSVAMCTYNGARYLQEQLNSIIVQTRLPDELIVCDDGSSDATMQIVKEFQGKAPFPVRIYCNWKRLGPTKNFEKSIALCGGEVIVLSDQDDVWMPQKLERLERALERHTDASFVFSDALVVDEMLNPLCYTMWEGTSFTAHQRKRFKQGHQIEVLLKHNVVTGATMALRGRLRDLVLPISERWIHDAWIALIASAAGERGILVEESLLKYRQHSLQVIGGRMLGAFDQFQKAKSTKGETYSNEETKFLEALDRLISKGKGDKSIQGSIEEKIRHLRARLALYDGKLLKRITCILQELMACRYHKFSNGWRSVAKDLILVK